MGSGATAACQLDGGDPCVGFVVVMSNHGDRENTRKWERAAGDWLWRSWWSFQVHKARLIYSDETMSTGAHAIRLETDWWGPQVPALFSFAGKCSVLLGRSRHPRPIFLPIKVSRDRPIAQNLLTGEAVRGSD